MYCGISAVGEFEILDISHSCCTYRLVKTVARINDELDDLKYEAEEALCSSLSAS